MVENRPLNLVFVRHGESEANVAQNADKNGDTSGYTEEYRNRANMNMHLTDLGVEQATVAGRWIKENICDGYFDRYYVSSFLRAKETAGFLDLPNDRRPQVWVEKDYLREQSYGHLDGLTRQERLERYPEIMATKKRDGVHWRGHGGESFMDVVMRARTGVIQAMHRELPDENGIAVTHGHFLWAVRIVLESLTIEMYEKIDAENNPLDKMHNCQVLQYTRVDPGNSSNINPHFMWVRSVCPWDLTKSRNDWQEIVRPKFSSAELRALRQTSSKPGRVFESRGE